MRNALKSGVLGLMAAWTIARPVHALPAYLTSFETTYTNAAGSRIDSCNLCHTAVPQLNSYGTAFATADHMFAPIEGLDSDGDGATNLAEIDAHSFPGNPSDTPPPVPTPRLPRRAALCDATQRSHSVATATHDEHGSPHADPHPGYREPDRDG